MTRHHLILAALVFLLASSGRIYSQCSIVSLEGPETIFTGEVLKIRAKVASASPNQPEFKWEISAGTITSDPKEPTIFVDTAGLIDQSITIKVKVVGIRTDCSTEARVVTRVLGIVDCGAAFDQYGDISFSDEKARLDNFAIQLLNVPDSRGELLAYAGQRTYQNEAADRLRRAKNYLMKVRHIEPERIITVDGGHRQDFILMLWVVPKGASPAQVDTAGLIPANKLDFSKPRPRVATRRKKS